jgi:hypothetical protein
MKAIGSFLNKKFIEQKKHSTVVDDKAIFFVFKKIVKQEFGNFGVENFVPDYFSGKTVFIKCKSPAWASELFLHKNKLMRRMNEELGECLIDDIKSK